MVIESVYSAEFKHYGKVLEAYDFTEFLSLLKKTPCPKDSVVYMPSDAGLEKLPVAEEMKNRFYGGMPIQIGYCNGHNGQLNCLEYHRDSEINVFATDAVLLVALESEIDNGAIHSDCVKAFQVPAGIAVELYATTLHYAPCSRDADSQFIVSIVLPRGTNTDKPNVEIKAAEDKLLWAKNKWLIAHPDSPEAQEGAYVGIQGENLRVW